MKLNRFLTMGLVCGVLNLGFAIADDAQNPTLQSDKDKLSYSLGVMTGQAFSSHAVDIDPKLFALGFSDSMQHHKLLLTQKEVQQVVQNFQQQSQDKARADYKTEADKNLAAGQKFLDENKQKPGVVRTTDGLQYKVIKAGSGAKPNATDVVTVNYEGKLIDGKVFDSSYERGVPASFQLNQVIKGWQEALQKMQPGAVWEIYLPADLAYGERGAPGIGPNQVLIFKVELISVKKSN